MRGDVVLAWQLATGVELTMFEECKLEGDFTLTSGKKSNVYYDFDVLSPKELLGYIDKLCIKLQGLQFDFVVSPALGGIIPGWVVAGEFGKRLLIFDKDGKTRGTKPGESISGNYIIVDDVISTYGTATKIAKSLPGLKCVGVAAFIFRGKKLLKNTYVLEHKEEEK